MIFCYIVHFVVRRLLCSNAATDISDVGIIFCSVERKYGLEKLSTSAKVSSKNISLLCCWKPFIAALPRMFKICLLVLLTLSFLQARCPSLMLLVGRQEGHPACKKTEWWGAWVVICLERSADLHMTQLMPLPLTVSCFSKIHIGFTFLVPAHPGSPGKRAVKWVCVSVCISDTIGWAIRRASYLSKIVLLSQTCHYWLRWGFTSLSTSNRSLWRSSTQPVSWLGTNFHLPHLHLVSSLGITPVEFC